MRAHLTELITKAEAAGQPLACIGLSADQVRALAEECGDLVLDEELRAARRPTSFLGVPIKVIEILEEPDDMASAVESFIRRMHGGLA